MIRCSFSSYVSTTRRSPRSRCTRFRCSAAISPHPARCSRAAARSQSASVGSYFISFSNSSTVRNRSTAGEGFGNRTRAAGFTPRISASTAAPSEEENSRTIRCTVDGDSRCPSPAVADSVRLEGGCFYAEDKRAPGEPSSLVTPTMIPRPHHAEPTATNAAEPDILVMATAASSAPRLNLRDWAPGPAFAPNDPKQDHGGRTARW